MPDAESSLAREKPGCAFLDEASKDAAEILLLGDLFDFWFRMAQGRAPRACAPAKASWPSSATGHPRPPLDREPRHGSSTTSPTRWACSCTGNRWNARGTAGAPCRAWGRPGAATTVTSSSEQVFRNPVPVRWLFAACIPILRHCHGRVLELPQPEEELRERPQYLGLDKNGWSSTVVNGFPGHAPRPPGVRAPAPAVGPGGGARGRYVNREIGRLVHLCGVRWFGDEADAAAGRRIISEDHRISGAPPFTS